MMETAVPTILTVDIRITGRTMDLAAEALAKDMVTFVVDMDFVANSEVEVKVITIVLAAATYREVIYVEVTLRTKGLVIDTAAIIYVNSLESTISAIRKAASLYNIL
jgi:hypothetical protein